MLRTTALSISVFALIAACSPDESSEMNPELAQVSAPPIEELHIDEAPTGNTSKQLSANGWGPLTIGMSLDELTQAAGADANPDSVGGPEPEVCDQFHPVNTPEGVFVMIENGVLTRISLINDAAITTDAGLSLGASSDDVRAAYNEVEVTPHKYQEAPAAYIDAWSNVESGDDAIDNFDARGIRYVIGSDGLVESIHAGGPSIRYVEGCL